MTGKSVMVVSGYFSPLHAGHLDMLEDARSRADHLVVIVNNNRQQVLKKGRVILDEQDRLRIVQALRIVDDALISVDDDPSVTRTLVEVAERYRGHEIAFGNGGDRQSEAAIPETEVCLEHGIELVFGVGGSEKVDSSTRINTELGLEGGEPRAQRG
ncbi:MAG: adenylyltransferase/cytidyltransferase family protein [Actinomycetota bacterium]